MHSRVGDYVRMIDGRKCTILAELSSAKYKVKYDGMDESGHDVIDDYNIIVHLSGPTADIINEFGTDHYLDDDFDIYRRLLAEFGPGPAVSDPVALREFSEKFQRAAEELEIRRKQD